MNELYKDRIITGDALTELKKLPDCSVDMCLTSPPYYGLRNYGVDGQIGLEATIDEYIRKLVEIFQEVRRVLKNTGTFWLNIYDSYTGSGKNAGGKEPCKKMRKELQYLGDTLPKMKSELPNKNMMLIPYKLIIALQESGWIIRQDIIWQKPNATPESVKDRCTKSHEYIFLLSKKQQYYFNADGIKEPRVTTSTQAVAGSKGAFGSPQTRRRVENKPLNNTGKKNRRDVWSIATKSYSGAHFATFPEELADTCIKAGCPTGGIVLDPFFGAGTTGVAAKRRGCNYIGIDINHDYCELARRRIEEKNNDPNT